MFENCKTNTDQGNVGLACAIFELQKLEYKISIPLNQNNKYDLVVEKDNTFYKVQIKTSAFKVQERYQVLLRTTSNNKSRTKLIIHNKGDYDLLFVLCSDGSKYLIPDSAIKAKYGISLNGLSEYQLK